MNNLGIKIEAYFDRLWPICRSIMGPGFRRSLDILKEVVPLKYLEFKTGDKVLDWVVPKEWGVNDAYIMDPDGKKIIDFKKNNVHLVGYSIPFSGTLSLSELKDHLHSLPAQPNAIPFVTSYYNEHWGFCLSYNQLKTLRPGKYKVLVDTKLRDGKLVLGQAILPGKSKKEILFSSYLCHPSLANDNLSGPLVLAFLYDKISKMPNREFTYRFLFIPETIGAIAFLSKYGSSLKKNLAAGFVLTCVGDAGDFTYKLSRQGNSLADRAALRVLKETGKKFSIIPFDPAVGSDERQYCSPGYNLPVGSLMRTQYTIYPEYHTSLDNKSFMDFKCMEEMVDTYYSMARAIEVNYKWQNKKPYGEPQVGRRGLFRSLSEKGRQEDELAMWWLLNLSDGKNDIISIAERSGARIEVLARVADKLEKAELLKK